MFSNIYSNTYLMMLSNHKKDENQIQNLREKLKTVQKEVMIL